MKLVIQTQYKENYGYHDWDGKVSALSTGSSRVVTLYVVYNLSSRFY